MKNVQITIDEETLGRVDQAGKPLGLNRSEIVRRALRDWLHRHAVESFEKEWIRTLKERPDEASRADDWSGIQAWSKK
ncbi:MAG: CopG family transcriptional regulator [Acidobacteria bacterium]|nr:CopG family transcriptional regulator [Acidobacteriota bacterium]